MCLTYNACCSESVDLNPGETFKCFGWIGTKAEPFLVCKKITNETKEEMCMPHDSRHYRLYLPRYIAKSICCIYKLFLTNIHTFHLVASSK